MDSQDRHRLLVDTIPHGIEEIDTAGRITYANRAYHEMYGYEDGVLVGTSILKLVASDEEGQRLAASLRTIAREQPDPTPQIRQKKRKDGRIIDVEIAWDYLRDDHGDVSGFIAIFTDITDRLRAETQLRNRQRELEQSVREGQRFFADSAAYVQTIISNMVDALITIDETGKIESFNPAAVELFGYDADEVIGRNVKMLMTGADKENHDGYITHHMETGDANIIGIGPREVIGLCRDGSEVYLELAVARTEFSGRTLFLGSLRDITKRREAETLHRESDQRMADFASTSADWFFEMDAGLRFCYLSETAYLPGHDVRQLLGHTRVDLKRAAHGPDATDAEIVAQKARKPYRGVERPSDIAVDQWLRVSGTPVYDEDGNFAGYRGTVTNVTDLHHAEQTNEQLLTAIENLSEGVALFDADDRLVVCNQKYQHLTGVPPEFMVPGISFEKLLKESVSRGIIPSAMDDSDAWLATRLEKRRLGSNTFEQKSGPFHLIVSEIRLPEDGSTAQVLLDVTELKEREELFRQAQKMDAVGQLTGGVAQDFNNLLTIILGNTELVKAKLGAEHELVRLIEPILRAAERGAELTHRMLAFSRRQPLLSKRVVINDLLENMNVLLQRSITAEIELTVNLAADLWPCMIDTVQFEQSVLNLAINARDAMTTRGRLEISTENITLAEGHGIAKLDLPSGDYVAVSVSDSGTGIARETLDKIFDPFFTTKDIGKGTGLGLSMVYGWANQSEGGVTVETEPGVGTKFTIFLPRSIADEQVIESADEAPEAQDFRGSETILVVEDETEVGNLVSFLLEDAGYNLLSAIDGGEAIENLRTASDIDMIITDIVLPGSMNGIEVARQAVSMRPGLKVMYLSGYGPESPALGGDLPSDLEIMGKPFEPKALLGQVRKILDEDSQRQHP